MRIKAQLVDATKGHHLWAERFDREMNDVFALQDEVTQKIVAALAVEMSLADLKRVRRKDTYNLAAYEYVLRGREYLFRLTEEANAEAMKMFQKAIELDPNYARAYAYIAWTHLNEWRLGWRQSGRESLEQAFKLAQMAVTLDDSIPSAHAALGEVYLWAKRPEQAVAEMVRAIALNSNDASNYAGLGNILTWAGRADDAIGNLEKAMRLDPQYPFNYIWYLGHAYFVMERYKEAVAPLKRLRDHKPNFVPAYLLLAASYAELGQVEEARHETAEALKLNPALSIAAFGERLPYKNSADLERLLAALRKAGLPE